MNRQEKQLVVETIKDEFKNSQSSFIIGVQGLTVEAIQNIKKSLRSKGASLKVAKNTLLKRAIEDMPTEAQLAPYFNKQIAIVFAKNDITEIAKILTNISKKNNNLTLVAGTIEEKLIDKPQIEFLALLPSKDVLRAQVCGALKAPISGFASALNQTMLKLLFVLKRLAEKQQ